MVDGDSNRSPTFERALRLTLDAEGVFSDHAWDPGGATKYGITEGLAREYGYEDVRDLTVEQARDIYWRHFWLPLMCDELPVPVAMELFDAAVNVGRRRGVKFLQRAYNTLRSLDQPAIAEDGFVGLETISAARTMARRYTDQLVAAQNGEQYAWYKHLTLENPETFRRAIRGWMRRLEWLHRSPGVGAPDQGVTA